VRRAIGRLERLAYERARRDAETASERGLWFDEEEAERAIAFFQLLRHSTGEWVGQPFVLTDWQRWLVGQLLGWKRADGSRRFRIAYVQIARKNGKSTLASGLALYLLLADQEPRAEVYSAATKRDQARIVFDEAVRMARLSPDLRDYLQFYSHSLVVPQLVSSFKPLSSDAHTLDGLNVHGAIIDELHAHRDGRVRDVIETATGARRQPLIFEITTAGAGQGGVCWEERQHAINVLEGTVEDDAFFAFITEPDEGVDWRTREYLEMANPNLGVTVKLEQLEEKRRRAEESPRLQNAFRRLHGNEWVEQVERWLDLAVWDECTGDAEWWELAEQLEGRRAWVGVDLSTNTDLTAAVAAIPLDDGRIALIRRSWIPEDRIAARVERDRVPYDRWARDGVIETTPGDVIDHDFIREALIEWARRYRIAEICYDPFLAMQFALRCQDDGLPMVEHRQGFVSMNEPSRTFERLLLARKIVHGGDPVLRWCAGNVAIAENASGLIKPDKKQSTERIDAIVAAIMAVGRAAAPQAEPRPPTIWSL